MSKIKTLEDKIRATMKSDETEGLFEIYFTRSFGYLWALFFRKLHVHPNVVTLLSALLGTAAGILFYYDSLSLNLLGMFLLVWANWYDCADGQLARMTGQKTLLGRILDGFVGDIWFFVIYVSLCFRYQTTWGFSIWILAITAGICHSKQCLLADYYRNIHLLFYKGTEGSELDSSTEKRSQMRMLSWKHDWFQKIYLYFYSNYVRSQEQLTPRFQQLRRQLIQRYGKCMLPGAWPEKFRAASRPLVRIANIITFDTRVIFLFIVLAFSKAWLYFLFEITVLNILFFYMRYKHEQLCLTIMNDLETEQLP